MGVDTAAADLWLVPLGAGYCRRPVWDSVANSKDQVFCLQLSVTAY